MNNCLFITKHDPFGIGGGSYATKAYLNLFSKISDNLFLIMAKECVVENPYVPLKNIYGVKNRKFITKIIQLPLLVFHRFYNDVMSYNSDGIKYVVLDHSCISSSFVKYFNKKGIITITIHHNVEQEYFITNSKIKYVRNILAFFIKKNERKAYRLSDINLFLTKYDLSFFEKNYGITGNKNLVTSVFYESATFFKNTYIENKYDFVISCTLSSIQNEKTIIHFFDKYHLCFDKYSVLITGRNPSDNLLCYLKKYKNVTIVQNPDNIIEIVQQAKVYLCPIEDGGGIKVRCFDALSLLMPVLLHENAKRGYEELVENKFFFTYDNVETLNNSINSIYNFTIDKDKYKYIVENIYSINTVKEKIISTINEIEK